MNDIGLVHNSALGVFDLAITGDGQLQGDDTIETAIIISLFTDARADASIVNRPEARRGWHGSIDFAAEVGSLIWTFEQARMRPETIARMEDIARKALQWLIDDGVVSNLKVSVAGNGDAATITIEASRGKDVVFNKTYDLFAKTVEAAG